MRTELTALVFAGGGSVGAAEVGMLQTLIARDVRPDFVVGASAGAINALYFAARPTPDGVAALATLWCALSRAEVFPLTRVHGMMALLGRRPSLLDPSALRRTLAARLPIQRLEDTVIPCHIVATSLRSGEEVVLSAGSALDALLATTALPVLFPPHRVGDRLLTDGGVAANAPIATALALGATRVIVLPTGFPCAVRTVPESLIATVLHTFSVMIARQLSADLQRVPSSAQVRIVPPLCPMHVAPHDFTQARVLIDAAAAQTQTWLDAGGLDHDGIPTSLQPHAHVTG
jgi:NTE family protein